MDISELLAFVVKNRASDLHLSAGLPPMIRVHGDIRRINLPPLEHKDVHSMIYDIMNDAQRKTYEENLEVDFSFAIPGLARFRVNAFVQQRGAAAVMRTIPTKVLTLEELNAPKVFTTISEYPRGLVLVTGPTGSGKSTTLAAMINYINENKSSHIITIEDPVEYVHPNKQSMITQRELGLDTPDFVQAIRGALRQDPDTILMGEMRDTETTGAAMTAANTGHLVFGTLHTLDAKTTLNRVIDMFPPHQQAQVRVMMAETLKGVVSQRLLRGIKGGRVPAVEILVVTAHVKKLIEDNHLNDLPDAMKKGGFYGMQTFNQSLVRICKEGLATEEEVLSAATNPDDVKLALRGIESEAKV